MFIEFATFELRDAAAEQLSVRGAKFAKSKFEPLLLVSGAEMTAKVHGMLGSLAGVVMVTGDIQFYPTTEGESE